MSNILAHLGLQSSVDVIPYHTTYFVLFNFFSAHVFSSPRFAKVKYGLDHNVAPRRDLDKYGDKAVLAGKLTQPQLEAIKRQEAAHANAIEHFPVFMSAMLAATLAGVEATTVNGCGLVYTVARTAYVFAYARTTDRSSSYIRSALWWVGNFACFRLVWSFGSIPNAARGL